LATKQQNRGRFKFQKKNSDRNNCVFMTTAVMKIILTMFSEEYIIFIGKEDLFSCKTQNCFPNSLTGNIN
jgi:hypothetical protein